MAGSVNDAYDSDDDTAKPWEKPLTTNEMRLRACRWTLADDSQLLAYLEKLSESIVTRTRDVQKDLNNLIHESQVSSVKVSNAINDFNLLSTLQFIENRVYDEDVKEEGNTAHNKVSAPKTKEQQEAALVARITQACQLGIEVVRSALEPLNLEAEGDSEDSEDESSGCGSTRAPPLLRLGDRYLDRPLPHLIGSEAFLKDDYVGLGDFLGEEDEKSSCGEYESAKSDSEVESEEESKIVPADNCMAVMMQEQFGSASKEESEDEEMLGEKEPVRQKVSKVTASSSELDSEDTFLSSRKKSLDKQGSVVSKNGVKISARTEEGTACLFGEPPRDMSLDGETVSPFGVKKGTFSGPGKLFDDDDDGDEGSVFGRETKAAEEPAPSIRTPKQTGYTESGKKIPAGAVSILGGGGQALFPGLSGLSLGTCKEDSTADETKASATEAVSTPKHSSKGVPAQNTATVTVSKLFEAEDEEEDDLWLTGTSKAKKDAPQTVEATKPTTLPATRDGRKPQVPTTAGLFNDDGNDLFTSSVGFKKPEPSKKSRSFLFDEEEDHIFAGMSRSKEATKSLFIHSTDTQDLFAGDLQPSVPKTSTKGLFLFEDDDDDSPNEETKKVTSGAVPDDMKTPAPVVGTKEKRSISLFDEEEADDDLFISRTPPTQMADSQSSHSVQSATWSSGSKENVEPPTVQLEVPTEQHGKAPKDSHFLFEDDDKMFAGPADESPDVDLFAPDVVDAVKAEAVKKKPIGGVLPFGGASSFAAKVQSKSGNTSISEDKEEATPGTKEDEENYSREAPFFPSAAQQQQLKKPTLKAMKEASVSFDESVDQSTTLFSATKDRAKIQIRRRLPSRRCHQRNVPPESDDAESCPPREETAVTPSAMSSAAGGLEKMAQAAQPASLEVQPAKCTEVSSLVVAPVSMMKSPSTEEEDLSSIVENSLKPVPEPSTAPKSWGTSRVQVPFGSVFDAKQEADDLFSLPSRWTASARVFGGDSPAKSDAVFGSGDKAAEGKSEDRPASLPLRESSKEVDLFTEMAAKKQHSFDEDYDIFSSSGKPLSGSSKQATLFEGEDADDIFATAPTPKRTADILQKPSPAMKHTTQSTTFKDPLLHGFGDDS